MVPAAMADEAFFNTERDGMALEEMSDNIDTVNVLKAIIQKGKPTQEEKDIYEQSRFDAEKDKLNSANMKRPVTG
jgi:inositol oxygenase